MYDDFEALPSLMDQMADVESDYLDSLIGDGDGDEDDVKDIDDFIERMESAYDLYPF